MKKTYSITGISCNGCVGHVKEQIEKHPDVTQVEITAVALFNIFGKPKEAVISTNQDVSMEELQVSLDKDSEYAGKYTIIKA